MKKHLHYYSRKQDSPLRQQMIRARLLGKEFSFLTGSGVFSKDRIDAGTLVLIDHMIIKDGWDVLDLGCGYGAVGICIAKNFTKCEVVMSDINERAARLARRNMSLNDVQNAEARMGDSFENISADEKFDTILINPPRMAGREVCFRMIEESFQHLKKNGLLQAVAKHNIGGRELSKKMKEVFGNVKEAGKKSGYRVYVSEK